MCVSACVFVSESLRSGASLREQSLNFFISLAHWRDRWWYGGISFNSITLIAMKIQLRGFPAN